MRASLDGKGQRVTPPSASYMSNDQFASYLSELRTNRASRPGGARPLPPSSSRVSVDRQSADAISQNATSMGHRRAPSQTPSAAAASTSSRQSSVTNRGRDYYPTRPAVPLKPSEIVPTAKYMERGQRWMEKEEAVSLREAMQEMDIREAGKEGSEDDESRLYNAALDEAAELVWQHQNGVRPPQPDGPYRYKPHLRRNSYAFARTASASGRGEDFVPSGLGRDVVSRSVSVSSTDSNGSSHSPRKSGKATQAAENTGKATKSYGTVGQGRRRTSLKRDISGEIERPFSGDQIWEEPEASSSTSKAPSAGRASPDKLNSKTQSPFNRTRLESSRGRSGFSKSLNQVEIHRNPPSQSRNPLYTTNPPTSNPEPHVPVPRKNGVEVRSDDIRAATSRRLKDRSVRLPEPTAVSDSPGRPIVSFDANWKAPDEVADVKPADPAQDSPHIDRRQSPRQPVAIPHIAVSEAETPRQRTTPRSANPTISISDDSQNGPSISIPTIDVPLIVTDDAEDTSNSPAAVHPNAKPTARPLPTPSSYESQARRTARPQGHWSPAPGPVGRATARCHECDLPIEGRSVALAGCSERFHPKCFSCYICGTSLEAMEISPEPDKTREERLTRIRRRAAGEILEEAPGMTAVEDGDERLRFYCHLDWHELFAPRCKHCKTPILGEHIVALGEHWHYGHFFCAECGDPFEHGMTHIEKDGYAWCINCQTKRTERRAPKCKKCKTAVIGQYIKALGGEWHEHCFRCAACDGGFDDGQIFPKDVEGGMVVLCTTCRTRELKL